MFYEHETNLAIILAVKVKAAAMVAFAIIKIGDSANNKRRRERVCVFVCERERIQLKRAPEERNVAIKGERVCVCVCEREEGRKWER
jgi:hypothetical protein